MKMRTKKKKSDREEGKSTKHIKPPFTSVKNCRFFISTVIIFSFTVIPRRGRKQRIFRRFNFLFSVIFFFFLSKRGPCLYFFFSFAYVALRQLQTR